MKESEYIEIVFSEEGVCRSRRGSLDQEDRDEVRKPLQDDLEEHLHNAEVFGAYFAFTFNRNRSLEDALEATRSYAVEFYNLRDRFKEDLSRALKDEKHPLHDSNNLSAP